MDSARTRYLLCEIWDFHSSDYGYHCHLRMFAM
jgi:hypothetical protein